VISTSIYWVSGIAPYRLALMPRPRGAEDLKDEIIAWQSAGIESVVSLLEAHEIRELELRPEEEMCLAHGIAYLRFPIKDRGIPEHGREFASLISALSQHLVSNKSLAIHCRAGIGRTGLVACCVLQSLGLNADTAFALLSKARGIEMPDTVQQRQYAESFLTRNGQP
jgi:protein-tyrosine phosphatase